MATATAAEKAAAKAAEEAAAAAASVSFKTRLQDARNEVKERGPSWGQNSFLVNLLVRELEAHDPETYTEEVREMLRTFSGASAMISVLKEKHNIPDTPRAA